MGKGSNKTSTTTNSAPWSSVQPYLEKGYKDLGKTYGKGAPDYYPGQTVAPMSGYTRGALNSMAERGAQGSDLTRAAQSQTQDTLGGNYLNSNPHLQGAMDSAIRPVLDNYRDVVTPGLDSQFSSSGRYGSGTHGIAAGKAGEGLLNQIGDITSNMSYQNYGDERQRMMQASALAPGLANQDYQDINMMGKAGEGIDAYNQQGINAKINKYNYNQNKDYNFTSDYLGLLNGSIGGSQTTTATQPRPNIFSSTMGGALGGAGIGNLFPGIGGPMGAMLGGAGGLLSGLF